MDLRRKALALISAVGLTLAFVPTVSAVTFKNCVNIDPSYAPTWHVLRNSTNYYAVQGEVVIRQLRGCTNADGSNNQDWHAWAWPANMEGTDDFKQIGYGVITSNGTGMNFWATKYAGFTEEVSEMSLAFAPAIGDTVRFSIYRYAPGGAVYWRLKVDDLSHPGWYGWRELLQVDPSVGKVWYGIEAQSKQSQFGSNSSTSQVRLRGLAYRLSNGGAWNYLTGYTGISQGYWANAGLGTPACWIERVSTYSGPFATNQTSVDGYTTNTC